MGGFLGGARTDIPVVFFTADKDSRSPFRKKSLFRNPVPSVVTAKPFVLNQPFLIALRVGTLTSLIDSGLKQREAL